MKKSLQPIAPLIETRFTIGGEAGTVFRTNAVNVDHNTIKSIVAAMLDTAVYQHNDREFPRHADRFSRSRHK